MGQLISRWHIEVLSNGVFPARGYVFTSSKRSYVCYSNESAEAFEASLSAAIKALREYAEQEPPQILEVHYAATRRAPRAYTR
jgi:hypothetical protein